MKEADEVYSKAYEEEKERIAAPAFHTGGARRELFRAWASYWHESTDAMSSPSRQVNHSAYQRIMRMGSGAIPFILEDLRDRGGYWFYALEHLHEASPVPPDAPPDYEYFKNAWLQWGTENRLI